MVWGVTGREAGDALRLLLADVRPMLSKQIGVRQVRSLLVALFRRAERSPPGCFGDFLRGDRIVPSQVQPNPGFDEGDPNVDLDIAILSAQGCPGAYVEY